MRIEKKVLEFNDCTVTITVRQKTPPAVDRNNDVYEFWNEELRDLYGQIGLRRDQPASVAHHEPADIHYQCKARFDCFAERYACPPSPIKSGRNTPNVG